MNKIKRKILKLKINIALTILWIIISGVYWKNLNIKDYEQIAKDSLTASTIAYDIKADNGYILNVTDNLIYEELEKITLTVYNETYTNNYYKMALKVEKKFDFDKINIIINNENYYLSELLVEEDDQFYYFVVGENEISEGAHIYEIGLYIDSSNIDKFMEQDYLIDFVELSSMNA